MSEMTELMGLPSSPMEYIMNALPGGTLITSDRVVRNVNTVYQQEERLQSKNKVKEWEEMADEGPVVRNPTDQVQHSKQNNNRYMEQQQSEERKGITLPTAPRKATAVNPESLCLYGKPKVGKTTILSELPNNLN